MRREVLQSSSGAVQLGFPAAQGQGARNVGAVQAGGGKLGPPGEVFGHPNVSGDLSVCGCHNAEAPPGQGRGQRQVHLQLGLQFRGGKVPQHHRAIRGIRGELHAEFRVFQAPAGTVVPRELPLCAGDFPSVAGQAHVGLPQLYGGLHPGTGGHGSSFDLHVGRSGGVYGLGIRQPGRRQVLGQRRQIQVLRCGRPPPIVGRKHPGEAQYPSFPAHFPVLQFRALPFLHQPNGTAHRPVRTVWGGVGARQAQFPSQLGAQTIFPNAALEGEGFHAAFQGVGGVFHPQPHVFQANARQIHPRIGPFGLLPKLVVAGAVGVLPNFHPSAAQREAFHGGLPAHQIPSRKLHVHLGQVEEGVRRSCREHVLAENVVQAQGDVRKAAPHVQFCAAHRQRCGQLIVHQRQRFLLHAFPVEPQVAPQYRHHQGNARHGKPQHRPGAAQQPTVLEFRSRHWIHKAKFTRIRGGFAVVLRAECKPPTSTC